MVESPLTLAQQRAVDHPLTPLFVVAGAGSGKTTVMARRMSRIVDSGQARADQLLGLTFSNKAASNLRERVRTTLGPDSDVRVTTYHGFGASLVDDHRLELGLAARTELLDTARAWQVLLDVFDSFEFTLRKTGRRGTIVKAALQLASRCADHLVDIALVAADCERIASGEVPASDKTRLTAKKRLELCPLVATYQDRKRALGLLDYGDQIVLAVRLLEANPAIAESLRERFPVVLLDEYQDTNFAQRRLLQLIYPAGSAVTAVGDDMQSIYGFRGAHLRNILDFEHHFPPAVEARLETNFRSGDALVELANRIQAQVGEARPKRLVAADGAAPTAIECFVAGDEASEARTIAESIAAAGPPFGETAVLCRKRRLIGPIVEALRALDVPVEVIGLGGLLMRPEIVDLLAWLEVVAADDPTVATLRLLLGPRYRIGLRDLATIARHGRAVAGTDATVADAKPKRRRDLLLRGLEQIDSATDLSAEAWTRGKAFAAERAAFRAAAERLPLTQLIDHIALQHGLWSTGDPRISENVGRFVDFGAAFVPLGDRPTDVASFLEYIQLIGESEDDLSEAVIGDTDAVRVMTIHQAKGLEFDTVYVPGLAGRGRSRIFPDDRSSENPVGQSEALPWWLQSDAGGRVPQDRRDERAAEDRGRSIKRDEEWRLLYVAVTRARRHLVLSAAHRYAGTDRPIDPQGPSEFYAFVAAQTAVVSERFHHEPSGTDAFIAAKQRRAAAAAAARYVADVPGPAPSKRSQKKAIGQETSLLGDEWAAPAPPAAHPVPRSLSVTSVVSYVRCPKQFYWSVVRPLPRQASTAATIGTAVHRWIEGRADPQTQLFDVGSGLFDVGAGGVGGAGNVGGARAAAAVDGLQQSFLASRYASHAPERVEAAFLLSLHDRVVRGRVDAAYRHDDDTLELVDFKTGRSPSDGDPSATTQLDLYALAAIGPWGADPSRLRTSYCYLRADGPAEIVTHEWTDDRHERVRDTLASAARGLAEERFDAHGGTWCRGCDFLSVCPVGTRATHTGSGASPTGAAGTPTL